MHTTQPLSWWQIFLCFFRLGCTAFGGPMAHLGLFRHEFVLQRRLISDAHYAELLSICQFLPGPTSSQVGFGIGLHIGSLPGACLAWLGFTAPAALTLAAIATWWQLSAVSSAALIAALGLAASAIVIHATWSMWRQFCRSVWQQLTALFMAGACLVLSASWWVPLCLLLLGSIWAIRTPRCSGMHSATTLPTFLAVSVRTALLALLLFIGLALALSLIAHLHPSLQLASILYRTGYLVFGGGHVVLPLLQGELVPTHILDEQVFLAGYGITQAMPGPIFNIASFVGASAYGQALGWGGALIAVVAIFLPSLLLLLAILPSWNRIRQYQPIQHALIGVNAAVTGLLLAVAINPIAVNLSWFGIPLVVLGVLALEKHVPAWLLVLVFALGGVFWSYVA